MEQDTLFSVKGVCHSSEGWNPMKEPQVTGFQNEYGMTNNSTNEVSNFIKEQLTLLLARRVMLGKDLNYFT